MNIAALKDLIPLFKVDIPHCADVLILQNLQLAAREFCRRTEAWHDRLTFNIVDAKNAYDVAYAASIALGQSSAVATIAGKNAEKAAREYILGSNYDAEIIRPWKIWDTGDETQPVIDPRNYDFTPSTNKLYFHQNLVSYLPVATTWTTTTAYTAGNRVINNSLRYECAIAHTSGTFATDLGNNLWILIPNDLIVQIVLMPRLTCNEVDSWFMDKWAEGIIALAKVLLMGMKNKNWSSPERVTYFQTVYEQYVSKALRERFTENKSAGMTFVSPTWTR